ncbi:hypothetical protein V1514DRAFT_328975 [Lipomyces japonicus]|uniref:mitochondrial 54S ribosomal protein mL61 n=1 Tax=Lipomyces japonicus TaxID=56871 RepID=UPI0034CEC819
MVSSRYIAQSKIMTRLAVGQGAVHVPKNITGIRLSFKYLNKFGHMGARKFWREYLPQIRFHNPSLAIEVSREHATTIEEHQKAPALLTVDYADQPSLTLDIKNKLSKVILEEFVNLTDAKLVAITTAPRGNPNLNIKLNR